MKTRIIICGGRNFDNKKEFYRNLDIILREYSDIEIISGNAEGADRFSEEYAKEKNIPVSVFKPDWKNTEKLQDRKGTKLCSNMRRKKNRW